MRAAALALALALNAPGAGAQTPCAVELVLALDVSRSVSSEEFDLQVGGLADAFRHPEVHEAVEFLAGGVMATVMIWGDARQQHQTTGWTHLQTAADLTAFADEVAATPRIFGFTLTGLGAAMAFADRLTETNPMRCRRRVIDISGDGVWNHGPRPADVWAREMSRDVTVNGLVILGATPDPLPHYRDEVIGGPAAFVEVASDFDDYPEAILQKLLRELAPSLSLLAE